MLQKNSSQKKQNILRQMSRPLFVYRVSQDQYNVGFALSMAPFAYMHYDTRCLFKVKIN